MQVTIGMNGNNIRLHLPEIEYQKLAKEIESRKGDGWITIAMDDNAQARINLSQIQYLKALPYETRRMEKAEGIPLKVIASVMDVSYDYLRQKIKRDGIDLDRPSERRVNLTEKTIKALKLTDSQVKKIKNIKS
jgi:hypothetical protein